MNNENDQMGQDSLSANNSYSNQNNINPNNNLSNNQPESINTNNSNLYDNQQAGLNRGQQLQTSQNNDGQFNSIDNNLHSNNYQNTDNQAHQRKEGLGTASLIIGIILLLLLILLPSVIFLFARSAILEISPFIAYCTLLSLPLAIVGLILGIVNKKKKGRKIAGIVLNSILIAIIVIPMVNVVVSLKTSENYVAGKYDCTGVDSNTDKYLVTLHLNKDNTFLFGPYGDLDNNYAKGTYTYEDEHKTNYSEEFKYFMLTMTGNKEDFITDGIPSDRGFNSKMEFGLTSQSGKKQGAIMFVGTYNMYYCYEQ